MDRYSPTKDKALGDDEDLISSAAGVNLEDIPKTEALLGLYHGKDKASAMRRSITLRKKPTRQGLRNSLFKSLDETELQNMINSGMAGVSVSHESEDTTTSQTTHSVLPSISKPCLTNGQKMMADINGELKLRKHQHALNRSASSPSPMIPTDIRQRQPARESFAQHNLTHSPRPPQRSISNPIEAKPILRRNHRNSRSESVSFQEPPKSSHLLPLEGKPIIQPIVHQRPIPRQELMDRHSSQTLLQAGSTQRHNSNSESFGGETIEYSWKDIPRRPVYPESTTPITPEEGETPWRAKLRRIETTPGPRSRDSVLKELSPRAGQLETLAKDHYHSRSPVDDLPSEVLPAPSNTGRLTPLKSLRLSRVQSNEDSSNVDIMPGKPLSPRSLSIGGVSSQQDIVLRSPTTSDRKIQSGSKESNHAGVRTSPRQLKSMTGAEMAQLTSKQTPTPPLKSINHPHDFQPRDRSMDNTEPAWIKQAAEKRKRASLLIEQEELNKQTALLEGTENIKKPGLAGLSSNTRGGVTGAEKHLPERRKLSSIRQRSEEPSFSPHIDKENNSTPAWKRQLRKSSSNVSRASICSTHNTEPGEPEFVRIARERQARLDKLLSQDE